MTNDEMKMMEDIRADQWTSTVTIELIEDDDDSTVTVEVH